MKKLITLTVLFISISSISQTEIEIYNILLKNHVSDQGKIDYKGLEKNKKLLDIYLEYLVKTVPSNKWSTDKARAFWLNAYNAYTLKLIIDNYPLKKITDIKKDGKNAWQLPIANIGRYNYTLDHIEHKVLRKWHYDARLHAGLNACATSGPRFPNFAFTEKNIDEKLEVLMKDFINDSSKNKISTEKLELSKVFEWYTKDFTQKGSLINYINKYAKTKANNDAQISYLEYDWTLNDNVIHP